MMFKRTYSIHILFAIFIFVNGCGGGKAKVELPVFSINASMKSVQDIAPAERNIASNICLALKSKSTNFKTTEYLGTRFIFQTQQKDCGVAGPINGVTTILSMPVDGSFHYSGAVIPSFNDFAQTDLSGYLSQVCAKINNNLPISNTTMVNGITVQITFFKDTLEGYMVQYFAKSTDDRGNVTSKMTSAETFKIRTQLTYVTGKIMGMDEYYSKDTICSTDATKASTFEQNFISR